MKHWQIQHIKSLQQKLKVSFLIFLQTSSLTHVTDAHMKVHSIKQNITEQKWKAEKNWVTQPINILAVKNKPGFSLLYGSYSCSKAQPTIFKIRCTALLSKRKSRGPITRLFVDFSWTIPKSSFFPEGKSCWFAEPTRSPFYINTLSINQTKKWAHECHI